MLNIESLVRYWSISLKDSELIAPKTNRKNSVNATTQEIVEGCLKDLTLNNLKSKLESSTEEEDKIKVLVAPFVYERKSTKHRNRNKKYETCLPLFIPATVTQEGILSISDQLPWIPRNFLEPSSSAKVFGNVQTFEDYASNSQIPLNNDGEYSWNGIYQYCEKMLDAVVDPDTFLVTSYKRKDDSAQIIICDLINGASYAIQNVYSNIQDYSSKPSLLYKLSLGKKEKQKNSLPPEKWKEIAGKHLGSVTNKYSLAPTQRSSYYNFVTLPEKSIQAIKGPPGTGKTTLLQTVIATKWIEAALESGEPPIIVASSTNNQAVVNVIKSFGDLQHINRWISVTSFGLFLSNKKRKDIEKEFGRDTLWVNNMGDDGFPATIEDPDFIAREKGQYLEYCSKFLEKRIDDIDEAVDVLHSYLLELNDLLQRGINIVHQLFKLTDGISTTGEIETQLPDQIDVKGEKNGLGKLKQKLKQLEKARIAWLKHLENEPIVYSLLSWLKPIKKKIRYRNEAYIREYLSFLEPSINPKDVIKVISSKENLIKKRITIIKNWESWLNEVQKKGIEIEENADSWQQFNDRLDTTLRYKLFEVATHYWEGRWFSKAEKFEETGDNNRDKRNEQGQEERFQRYACLTPCMVTTLHSGPSFFYYYDGEKQPLYEFIDLLIIDEAGQVSPEVSGGMLALAKQALVVGDTKQIEPIQNITEEIDKGNLEQLRLIASDKNDNDFTNLKDLGILSSSGSVMQLAEQVSEVSPEEMVLKEHWRCVPDIIGYCNELAYNGQLIPKRNQGKDFPWPAMGYVHVRGNCEKSGSSHKNQKEALTIVEWIKDNEAALKSYYNVSTVKNLIGIVTPYSPQKREIKRLLKSEGIAISKVGTVHSLQGAERPIVIFSPVCDRKFQGNPFYDDGINMLNVAVSRAKDSFIVVGDMEVFDPDSNKPSGVLARHLFKDGANELTVNEVINENGVVLSDEYRITDLKKHRDALKKVFTKAKKRVVVVSPFIRDRAVKADKIVELTKQSTGKGVEVEIYIDNYFNGGLKLSAARKACERLEEAGAEINICHNIHSKILCRDEDVFIEGSFNWLSSERTISKHVRYDTSSIHMNDRAKDYIRETLEHLEERRQRYQKSVSVN